MIVYGSWPLEHAADQILSERSVARVLHQLGHEHVAQRVERVYVAEERRLVRGHRLDDRDCGGGSRALRSSSTSVAMSGVALALRERDEP